MTFDYGGYVNGIIGSGTETRGRVYFALPLDKTLYGADIAITLEMAARADEIVDYRDYEILIGNGVISKWRLVAPNYTAISFIITAPLIEANVAKFTLKPLNYSHGHDKDRPCRRLEKRILRDVAFTHNSLMLMVTV